MPVDSPFFWLLAIVGVLLTGISKSGFAGGAGVVAVPLLALVISVPQAAALMLPLLIIMDMRTIQYYRRHLNWQVLKGVLPAAVLGIAAGGLFMGSLSDQLLQIGLGLFCIVFALWASLSSLFAKLSGAAWLWGTISGLSSTFIHAGGPPINIYLISLKMNKLEWLATAGVLFGLMNLIKLIPYTINSQWNMQLIIIAAMLTPVAWLGVSVGKRIQEKISEQYFTQACRHLLLFSGAMLLLKGLVLQSVF